MCLLLSRRILCHESTVAAFAAAAAAAADDDDDDNQMRVQRQKESVETHCSFCVTVS